MPEATMPSVASGGSTATEFRPFSVAYWRASS
jgi:hypothetical protein